MNEKPTPTTEDRAMTILRWMGRGDKGVSSEVLALASVGVIGSRFGNCEPGDEQDCGRCERLAHECPFVVEALPGLVDRNPRWARWADQIKKAAGT